MNDNVFQLADYRHKARKRTVPSALPGIILDARRAGTIDHATWSKDIRLNSEPSLTVRTTAVNVLSDFRVHPVSGSIGQQHVLIELRLDLLKDEELRLNDFTERSAKLVGRLLGREVNVQQQSNSATILLVYSAVHPSITPHPA